jgi:hypothetical protein
MSLIQFDRTGLVVAQRGLIHRVTCLAAPHGQVDSRALWRAAKVVGCRVFETHRSLLAAKLAENSPRTWRTIRREQERAALESNTALEHVYGRPSALLSGEWFLGAPLTFGDSRAWHVCTACQSGWPRDVGSDYVSGGQDRSTARAPESDSYRNTCRRLWLRKSALFTLCRFRRSIQIRIPSCRQLGAANPSS